MALIGGIAVAGPLSGLNFVINPDSNPTISNVVFTAQYPGWLACAYLLPGSFETSTTASYIMIAIPVNAAFYTIVIFAALRVVKRR
jgi:hypothetical protein